MTNLKSLRWAGLALLVAFLGATSWSATGVGAGDPCPPNCPPKPIHPPPQPGFSAVLAVTTVTHCATGQPIAGALVTYSSQHDPNIKVEGHTNKAGQFAAWIFLFGAHISTALSDLQVKITLAGFEVQQLTKLVFSFPFFGTFINVSACMQDTGKKLPTSGSEPPYEPEKWRAPKLPAEWNTWTQEQKNDWLATDEGKKALELARVQRFNNCYNYACNKPNPGAQERKPSAEPGRGGGYTPKNGWCKVNDKGEVVKWDKDKDKPEERIFCNEDMNCEELIKAAKADGLVEVGCDEKCPEGGYKKALVLDPLTEDEKKDQENDARQTDYHWYRQDKDGTWSHKRGQAPATNEAVGDEKGEGKGENITDPRDPKARGSYTEFCGCFCCGKDVKKAVLPESSQIVIAALPSTFDIGWAQPPPTIQVSELHFFGRPDPQWEITNANEIVAVVAMLKDLPPTNPPNWPLFGERGFLLFTDNLEVLATYGFPPTIVQVFRGVIQIGPADYYLDIHGLEAWLQARRP